MKTSHTCQHTHEQRGRLNASRGIPAASVWASLLALAIYASAVTTASAQIDNLNGNATPGFFVWSGGFNNEGWEYTPTLSFSLTGISSYFEPVPNGGGLESVTVQLYTAPPPNGGTLLDQETFSVDSGSGGWQGGTLSTPLTLTAGQTYFVGFVGINGLGVNVGQWADDGQGNPAPSDGATVNLGDFWYGAGFPNEGDPTHSGAYAGTPGSSDGTISIEEPILNFYGTATPEPSTGMLFGIAGALLFGFHRSRWQRATGQRVPALGWRPNAFVSNTVSHRALQSLSDENG